MTSSPYPREAVEAGMRVYESQESLLMLGRRSEREVFEEALAAAFEAMGVEREERAFDNLREEYAEGRREGRFVSAWFPVEADRP